MKKYNTPMTEVMKVESGAFLMGTGEGSVNMEGGVKIGSMAPKNLGIAWS